MVLLEQGGAEDFPLAGFASLGLDFLGLNSLAVEPRVCTLIEMF